MNTTFKPGQIVQHPEKGYGLVRRSLAMPNDVLVMRLAGSADAVSDYDLTGWEPVEAVAPGHVQVRVDDLDADTPVGRFTAVNRLYATIRAESHTEPATSETVTDSDARNLTATVSLSCPDCGETITRGVRVANSGRHTWTLELLPSPRLIGQRAHRCKPAQPDEPQEFGARVSVTRPDGTREPWLRVDTYTKRPWLSEVAGFDRSWNQIKQRGQVSLGWGEAQ